MTAQSIHIIRHGESTFNAAYREIGKDPMMFDAPLSPLGRRQVGRLADELSDVGFELAVTSPFTRAIQTCLGLFGGRDVPVVVEPLHRERCGASCDIGRSPQALAAAYPALDFTELNDPWWYVDGTAGLGIATEPIETVQARARAFRHWLRARPERRIAVVGHVVFFSTMTEHVLENCGYAEIAL